jgi:hypothetical protein
MFGGQSPSPPPHASGSLPMHLKHRTIANFLDQSCRDDMDAKVFSVIYAYGISFNVLYSPYWHDMVYAINDAPKGYRGPKYDKLKTTGLDKKRCSGTIYKLLH